MKKGIIFTTGALCLLNFFTSSALTREGVDLGKEGMKVLEAGQVLQNCTGQDHPKMVDQGHMMIKKGEDIMSPAK
jgi:hypothetical protein